MAQHKQLMYVPVAELGGPAYKEQLEQLRASVASQAGGNKQIIRAGWMLKRKDKGRGKVSGWKKRFVVLDVDTVSYFKGPGEDRLGAFELLLTEAKAPAEEVKAGGKPFLQLVTVDAVYGLACAEDGASIGDWLMAIVEQRRVLFEGKNAANAPNKALAKMGGQGQKNVSKTSTLGADYMRSEPSEDGAASVASNGPAEDPKRAAAVRELISTEEVYVNNLGVIIRQWKHGLAAVPGVDPQSVNAVFSNVELLEPVNAQLLARLRRPDSRQAIGQQFLEMMPFFKMYKDYCGNQESAMAVLDGLRTKKAVREFLDKTRDHPACSSMNIESFLIMPMQRICRYPLVLGEILKWTPEDWEDHAKLQAALEAVSAVGKEVNEQKKQAEQQVKMLEIQTMLLRDNRDNIGGDLLSPSRKFIGERTLVKATIWGEEVEEPHIYLFNDLLLVCRVDAKKKKTTLLHRIPLWSTTEVQELPWGFTEHNGFAIHQEDRGRVELEFQEGDSLASEWRQALSAALLLLLDVALRRGDDGGEAESGEVEVGSAQEKGIFDRLRKTSSNANVSRRGSALGILQKSPRSGTFSGENPRTLSRSNTSTAAINVPKSVSPQRTMSSGSWKRPAKAGSAPSTQTENSPRDGAAGSSPVSTKSPRGIGGGKSPRFSLLGNKDKEPAPSPTMPASRLSKSAIELIEELGKGGASPGSAIAHEEESDDEPEESSDEVREREMKKKDAMKPPRKPLPSLPIAQTSGDNAEDQDEEEIVVYE